MRLGIICPSEIAIRRFMPALEQCNDITFAGIGVYTKKEKYGDQAVSDGDFLKALDRAKKKAGVFTAQYGGKIFNSYEAIASSDEIDALYIPLPPALHFKWAKIALENGKHVLVEKPSTTSAEQTKELVRLAEENGLALHENYMFAFHSQLDAVDSIIRSGEIGDIRLYRISFGFPMRSSSDFRYNKALGGGALIDAGGYTIRYATHLLGPSAHLCYAVSNDLAGFQVDMYGSGAMCNDSGVTAQFAFGMDNSYKCELEAWGSTGCLTSGRILTAPAGFVPTATIRKGDGEQTIELPADDAFLKSIRHFMICIENSTIRKEQYNAMIRQAELVDEFRRLSGAD